MKGYSGLVRAASLLVDECAIRTFQLPRLLLPPEAPADLTSLLGCEVIHEAAAPGWVVAKAPDGQCAAAAVDGYPAGLYTPTMARFVGGPLDGTVRMAEGANPVYVPVFPPLMLPSTSLPSRSSPSPDMLPLDGVYRALPVDTARPDDGPAMTADRYLIMIWMGTATT